MFGNKHKAQQEQKRQVALAAVARLEQLPLDTMVLGIGTGSTVNLLIEHLAARLRKSLERPLAASSKASRELLQQYKIEVEENTNMIQQVDLYLDGADEVDEYGRMIKGGGGALTGEKIIASMSKEFWCLVDESKLVPLLGEFPVAVEVTEMARSLVSREIVKLGGNPEYRGGFVSDHGNPLLDVYGLDLTDPLAMEEQLNNLPGVLANGIFASQSASKVLYIKDGAVVEFTPG